MSLLDSIFCMTIVHFLVDSFIIIIILIQTECLIFINNCYNALFFLEEFESIVHFHISSSQCCNNNNNNVKYNLK